MRDRIERLRKIKRWQRIEPIYNQRQHQSAALPEKNTQSIQPIEIKHKETKHTDTLALVSHFIQLKDEVKDE